MLEVPSKCYNQKEDIRVIKGVSERLNYYFPTNTSSYYDLRYNFPLNYFNGVSAFLKNNYQKYEISIRKNSVYQSRYLNKRQYYDELKISANGLTFLGIS